MRLRDYWLLYTATKDRTETPQIQLLEEEGAFYAGALIMLTLLEGEYRRDQTEQAS
jgi:hypothetical protein